MAEEQKDFSKYFTGLFFKRMMIKKNLLDFYILKRKKTENQNKFWFFPSAFLVLDSVYGVHLYSSCILIAMQKCILIMA